MFVYLFYQDVDITIRIINFALAEYFIRACVFNNIYTIQRIKNFPIISCFIQWKFLFNSLYKIH